jgi:hypothetical protein
MKQYARYNNKDYRSFIIYFSANYIVCQEEVERCHILDADEDGIKIQKRIRKKKIECKVNSSGSK